MLQRLFFSWCAVLLFVNHDSIVLVVRGNDDNVVARGNDDDHDDGVREVEITGNPHNLVNKTTTTSDDARQCTKPCVSNLPHSKHALFRATNLVTQRQQTQQDTLNAISYVTMGGTSSSTTTEPLLQVPLYHFQQSKRISSQQLPFQLILVLDLVEELPHYVMQVPMKHAQDSWFVHYYWSIVIVCDCHTGMYQHIGWKFTRVPKTQNDNDDYELPYFHAIIVRPPSSTITTKTHSQDGMEPQEQHVQVMGLNAPDWMVTNMLQQTKNMTANNDDENISGATVHAI
mmetsp:Transcript_23663/g.36544  ORF Transcript_23663/g.36544 Transcript_23663/m.36544 type:complete len:286 (+) Transcript_23663:228-1085(+)|eukprot:CAMPEP_0195299958 /NCGR_PEP_ID=MMETSP0707-20130614/26506_1 /TAXON_ID=33640 /ORGANISM="Asterionellopsis glacialis, Strain CCMP134" /LENGTH=285 /DNA_ID=CAMNT_0040362503 /DNA_START=94 /DNA_END=951 /DNA_ORIENTATION=-